MLNGTTDYWALLGTLNLSSAYKPRSQPYSLATHGSHTVNGVQLVPGAPGYDPKQAYGQWIALMTGGPPAPVPTISVSGSAAGFTVTLNVAGTVATSVFDSFGSFAAGSTLLIEQTTLKEGFLTLSASGLTSTATSQYVGELGSDPNSPGSLPTVECLHSSPPGPAASSRLQVSWQRRSIRPTISPSMS